MRRKRVALLPLAAGLLALTACTAPARTLPPTPIASPAPPAGLSPVPSPSFVTRDSAEEAAVEAWLELVRAALERGEGPDPAVNTVDTDTLWIDGIYRTEENNFTYVYAEGTAGDVATYWTFELLREPPDGAWRIGRWYASLTSGEFYDSPLGFPLGPQPPWYLSRLGEPVPSGTDLLYKGVKVSFYAPDGIPDDLEEIADLSECGYGVQLIGLSLTGPEYPTARGIRVGEDAAALLAAYPSSDRDIGETYTCRPPFSEWVGELVFTLDREGIITSIEYCYNIN